jgi:hypothetical protein
MAQVGAETCRYLINIYKSVLVVMGDFLIVMIDTTTECSV